MFKNNKLLIKILSNTMFDKIDNRILYYPYHISIKYEIN